MAKPLRVKAFLQYPEGLEFGTSPEVRRFKVTRDGDDLYRRLVETLPTVFPNVKGLNYSLYWKDGDDDMVQFSSMDELKTALENTTDNLLRVYIVVDLDTNGGETTTTSDTEGEERKDTKEEETKTPKRVRFHKAGKRWRRRLRRLRKSAMTDDEVVSKDFRKAIRVLMKQAHVMHEKKSGKGDNVLTEEDQTTLGSLTPEAQAFVQQILDEWHSKLTNKRLRVVAKSIRKEKRTFPLGFEKDHFRWLCCYMARWHRRHAGKCDVMSGWSSGEAGDTSGDEETLMMQNRKDRRRTKRSKQLEKAATAGVSDSEDTDGPETSDYKVPKEFRKGARALMAQLHRKRAKAANKELETVSSLSPQQQAFIISMADEWHTKLATKRPKVVAKRMRKRNRELPSEITVDHFRWLCRSMGRWHRRHAGKCDVMSGWSSGETGDDTSDDELEETRKAHVFHGSCQAEEEAGSESAATDCLDTSCKPVSKEFRSDVRLVISLLHKDTQDVKKTPLTLTPEVHDFLKQFCQEWHNKLSVLSKPRPRAVSKEMKEAEVILPSRLEKEQYRWLCCFMARWHRKHAGRCDAMSGVKL